MRFYLGSVVDHGRGVYLSLVSPLPIGFAVTFFAFFAFDYCDCSLRLLLDEVLICSRVTGGPIGDYCC